MNKPATPEYGPAELEEFKADLSENMRYLELHYMQLDLMDQDFAESLCDFYERAGTLSAKQLPYALRFWRRLKNRSRGTGSESF